jgi:hypothetical protein
VLDYFWTSVTGGHGRSRFGDGFVSDTAYKPGDIKDGYSDGQGDSEMTPQTVGVA